MFEMRQSRLDRQDQMEYVIEWAIPDAYKALSELDREFNRLTQDYALKRKSALDLIKNLNSFEIKLYNSL